MTTSEIDIMYIDSINTSPSETLDILLHIFECFVNTFDIDDSSRKIQFDDDSRENIFVRVKQYYPIKNVSSAAYIKII